MNRISALLRKTRDDLLRQGPCSIDEVIRAVRRRYADELAAERERLLELALRREVKEVMREATSEGRRADNAGDDGAGADMTPLLPGLEPPAALAVPTDDGGYRYVLFAHATWEDLLRARREREANFHRAGARLRDFDLKLAALEPYMAYSNNITVADACRLMATRAA